MGRKKNSSSSSSSSCAILPHLYLGPRTAASAAALAANNITDVLSIGSQPPTRVPGVSYHRISLADGAAGSFRAASEAADEIISAVESAQPARRVLVHCAAGVSRSPAVVAAYLVKRRGWTLFDALAAVVRARAAACPAEGFVRELRAVEVEVRGVESVIEDELPRERRRRLEYFGVAG